jgi:hypothetical protein
MKWTLALILVPGLSFAGKIPVGSFDQSKLEQMMRRIPSALVMTEEKTGFTRLHYLFPKGKGSVFTIKCQADYYLSAPVPSFKSCEVNVAGEPEVGDEYRLKVTDSSTVGALYSAITYGQEVKKHISNEVIYAQSYTGKYKNTFRYAFVCQKDSCEITFVTKEATY